jgi:hypothetical protein
MKKLVVLAALLFVAKSAYAQEQYLELVRSDLKTQKVALITEAMQMTDEQSEAFWPIYREYDLELTKLGDVRLAAIKDFAANYNTMTDEKADELAKSAIGGEKDRTKLREKYYKKFAKELSPTVAARWWQVERQIGLLMDLQIANEMPLVQKGREEPTGQP